MPSTPIEPNINPGPNSLAPSGRSETARLRNDQPTTPTLAQRLGDPSPVSGLAIYPSQLKVAKVAGDLGIPVIHDAALEELNHARQSMTQHFNRRC